MTKRRRKSGGSKPAGTMDGVGRFDSRAPSITQMRMFLMVVDEGSFAAAARKIGRATSVVSYSIAKLEAQLGVSLFTRDNTRKPQLTEVGWTVLSKTRTIISDVVTLSARVRGLNRVFEPEVLVALDGILPSPRVVDAIKVFRVAFPTVSMHVRVEASSAVAQLVLARAVTVGVSGLFPGEALTDDIEAIVIGSVDLVPVCAPSHLLARGGAPASEAEHVQLVLANRSAVVPFDRSGLVQPWRLTDLTSMQMLLKEGVGWGYLPEPMVNADIESGQLVALSGQPRRSCVLHAIYRKDTSLGPAASFLVSSLVGQVSGEHGQEPQIVRAALQRAANLQADRRPAECGLSRLAGKA
jgi:DNA-binding transcriptional LysR family regulator